MKLYKPRAYKRILQLIYITFISHGHSNQVQLGYWFKINIPQNNKAILWSRGIAIVICVYCEYCTLQGKKIFSSSLVIKWFNFSLFSLQEHELDTTVQKHHAWFNTPPHPPRQAPPTPKYMWYCPAAKNETQQQTCDLSVYETKFNLYVF